MRVPPLVRFEFDQIAPVVAIFIPPDHLHAIWTLPEIDADYSRRWTLIKSSLAHTMRPRTPNVSTDAGREINVGGYSSRWSRSLASPDGLNPSTPDR
jgi:REP element-mobilizing transposase RayT